MANTEALVDVILDGIRLEVEKYVKGLDSEKDTLDDEEGMARRFAQVCGRNASQVIEALGFLRPRRTDVKKKVAALRDYLKNNLDRMHYPHYRAMGLRIGSGAVESANYHVTGARMKLQGMRWSEVATRHPKAHRRLMEEPLSVAPPEGEALRDVLQRVRGAVAALAGRHPGEAIVVVCSATVCGFVGACVEGSRVVPPRPAEADACQWRALEMQVATQDA